MRSPTKDASDRRVSDRRSEPSLPVATRQATGERRVVEQRKVGTAMVDALEDILKWERASERAIRVAAASASASALDVGAGAEAGSTTDLDARSN